MFSKLRILHGKLYEWRKNKCKQISIIRNLKLPIGKKVYIIGTPTHTNIGDSAIVVAERDFLLKHDFKKKSIKEFSFDEFVENSKYFIKFINKKHLIAHHGGGNIGNQWLDEEKFHRRLIQEFPENPQIIFPQTIYFTNDEIGHSEFENSKYIYNKHRNLSVVARESVSYATAKELFYNSKVSLTPDIVLSTNKETFGGTACKRNGIVLCFRNDCEKSIAKSDFEALTDYLSKNSFDYSITDMHTNKAVTKFNRDEIVKDKIQEFLGSKLVITDRLHGMIFAAITETPCIALSNYNHKVNGTYNWISYLPYIRFSNSIDDAIKLIPEMTCIENAKFDNAPLMPYFDKLAEEIIPYA